MLTMKLLRVYLPLALGLLALVVGLAACGSSGHASTTPPPAASTEPSAGSTTPPASTTTTTTASTTATSTSPAPATPGGPAGGPVPHGFDPVSFTAVSDDDFWLLGTAPCSSAICTSIVRSTDGGAHFVGIPAPVEQLTGVGTSPGLSELRFADSLDGFAGSDGEPGPLWATHDGGEHWQVTLPDVMTFTVSAGLVDAITGSCSNGVCSNLHFDVTPASHDAWSSAPLPLQSAGGFLDITAHGVSAWITLSPATQTADAQTLLYTDDAGVHPLITEPSPCTAGLGGDLEASSDSVVWAVCPTGMMAGAWRSTDAGAHWTALRAGTGTNGPGMSNGARLAAVSDTTAVLATGDVGQLLRSTDGGLTFTTIVPPGQTGQQWQWLGFTDPMTGAGLRFGGGEPVGPERLSPLQLWRSIDGGVSWHPITIG